MKIYVINFKKLSGRIIIASLVLVIMMISILSFNLLRIKYGNKEQTRTASVETGRVIIIDPGHGGEDPGAVGVNGAYEKDLNLQVAICIGEMLIEKGYTVMYTRTEDRMLYTPEENIKGMRKISDLKNRCAISKYYDDCIFVSIHMNTYGSSKYSGLQVYYQDQSKDSETLAASIQGSVKEILQPDNKRAIKNGKSLYLLENSSGTPVLIECGFLSNSDECKKLSEKEYQKQLSFSIVCGIINYIEEIDNKK